MTGMHSKRRWLTALLRFTLAGAAAVSVNEHGRGTSAQAAGTELRAAALDRLMRFRERPDLGTLALERLARDGNNEAGRALTALARDRRLPAATAALLRLGDAGQIGIAKQFLADPA